MRSKYKVEVYFGRGSTKPLSRYSQNSVTSKVVMPSYKSLGKGSLWDLADRARSACDAFAQQAMPVPPPPLQPPSARIRLTLDWIAFGDPNLGTVIFESNRRFTFGTVDALDGSWCANVAVATPVANRTHKTGLKE